MFNKSQTRKQYVKVLLSLFIDFISSLFLLPVLLNTFFYDNPCLPKIIFIFREYFFIILFLGYSHLVVDKFMKQKVFSLTN